MAPKCPEHGRKMIGIETERFGKRYHCPEEHCQYVAWNKSTPALPGLRKLRKNLADAVMKSELCTEAAQYIYNSGGLGQMDEGQCKQVQAIQKAHEDDKILTPGKYIAGLPPGMKIQPLGWPEAAQAVGMPKAVVDQDAGYDQQDEVKYAAELSNATGMSFTEVMQGLKAIQQGSQGPGPTAKDVLKVLDAIVELENKDAPPPPKKVIRQMDID